MIAALPPELRDQLGKQLASQAQLAGALSIHTEHAEAAASALAAAGFGVGDVRDALDIGKAWHGLHFLLAGTAWDSTAPPGNAVLGERVRSYFIEASERGDAMLPFIV